MQNLSRDEMQRLFYVAGIVTASTVILTLIVLTLGVAMVAEHRTALHIFVGIRLLIASMQLVVILRKGVIGAVVRYAYLLHRDGYVVITVKK